MNRINDGATLMYSDDQNQPSAMTETNTSYSNLTLNQSAVNSMVHACLLDEPVCSFRYANISSLVAVSTLFGAIVSWTILGNLLVITALCKFQKLRSMSNCLIGNLALSDLLLATTILPIASGNDLLGYWVFGRTMCTIWLVCDVLYCTASIWGLCIIAIDRYTATAYPVWYHEQRSSNRALLYIVIAWVVSIIISTAPFIGWRDMIPSFYQHKIDTEKHECLLFMTKSYVLYSAVGSFIIPAILMVFLYSRIFTLIHRRSREMQKKYCGTMRPDSYSPNGSIGSRESDENEGIPRNQTCPGGLSDKKEYRSLEGNLDNITHDGIDSSSQSERCFREKIDSDSSGASAMSCGIHKDECSDSVSKNIKLEKLYEKRMIESPIGIHLKHKIRFDRRCKSVIEVPAKMLTVPKTGRIRKLSYSWGSPAKRSLEKRRESVFSAKRKFEMREQKATKRMALIIVCFGVCWMPFLFMYTIRSFCDNCSLNKHFTVGVIWLGYINSALNPILYTLFNADFRKAIYKMLHFKQKKRP